MHTFSYEIVVPQVKDKDGVELKKAERLAHGEGLVEEPGKLNLLQEHHAKFTDAQRKYSEATVTVRPFAHE